MLPILLSSFTLLATTVAAIPHGPVIATLVRRQTEDVPSKDCNATCAPFVAMKRMCSVPHCGCSNDYLQAQGDCLLCETDNAQDAASVEFLIDAEVTQCQSEGLPINFKLELPPDAQAIVDDFDLQSAHLRDWQAGYLGLHIAGGHIGLVIVLGIAIFSREVNRDPTFINFCVTWIFSSVVYSLMLYRGTEGNTIANTLGIVSPGRCLVQAALTNGAQVMTAGSTMALVVQLWIGLRATIEGALCYGPKQRQWTMVILLALPYVLFVAFAIPSFFAGQTQTVIQNTLLRQVLPSNFYCSVIGHKPFLRAIYGVTLGLLFITTIFDALIIGILYRFWWAYRRVQQKSTVSLSILIRVIGFSIYRVGVAVTYGTVLERPPQVFLQLHTAAGAPLTYAFGVPIWVDMLQAAIPLVAFLALGVNREMFSALLFCRRKKKVMPKIQVTSVTDYNVIRTGEYDEYSWDEKRTPT